MDASGASIPCCMWAPSAWAKSYMSITSLVLLWTLLLFGELRVFVVSGTIAQWYFQPAGADNTKVRDPVSGAFLPLLLVERSAPYNTWGTDNFPRSAVASLRPALPLRWRRCKR